MQLCIHKDDLSELDVYQRILRHKNYVIAMVNMEMLPPTFDTVFFGRTVYFTNAFKVDSVNGLRKSGTPQANWIQILNRISSSDTSVQT